MGKGVGGDPGDGLPQHLCLVVDALDGEEHLAGQSKGSVGARLQCPCHCHPLPRQEVPQGAPDLSGIHDLPPQWPNAAPQSPHLAQGAGGNDVVLEFHGQAPAQLDGLDVALARAGKGGEQEAHGQGIVQVPQGIDERGVPVSSGGQGGVTPSPRVLQKLLRLGETPSEKGMGTVEHPPACPSTAGQRMMENPDLGRDPQGLRGFLPPVSPSLIVTKLSKALAALTLHQPSKENTPHGEQGSSLCSPGATQDGQAFPALSFFLLHSRNT